MESDEMNDLDLSSPANFQEKSLASSNPPTREWIFCILPSLFQPEFQSFVLNSTAHYALHNNSPTDDPKHQQPFDMEETELRGEDIKMVLQRLGISPSPEDAGEKMIPALFADEEPSLEEVMEAFHVFDENRDGFIDAKELQRILSKLGFREASNPNLCNVMIRAFDENGDGRIDFKEFVKLIEKDFC
ncbi:hypothetical protein ACLOJK_022340 [Asimina triloba]